MIAALRCTFSSSGLTDLHNGATYSDRSLVGGPKNQPTCLGWIATEVA